jgi:undecaprenyl-diphosphatase
MGHITGNTRSITPFLALTCIYLTGLSILLITLGYHESFFVLNSNRTPWLDWPMFIVTHLGDSMILASILTLLYIRQKPEAAITVIIVVIITGVLGQLLKITFFEQWDRPLRVFNESTAVHTLANYRLFHNSFPSGHSITAMAAFTALVWCLRPGVLFQLLFAVIAILITYSRIYLGVHFPGDVLAGSMVGIITALLIIPFIYEPINAIRFRNNFKIAMTILSVIFLIAGTFFLRIYFPLI